MPPTRLAKLIKNNISSVDAILKEGKSHNGFLPPQKLLEYLVRIPSISDNEDKAVSWLAQQMRKGSFDEVYTDDMHNVIGIKGEGDKVVLLTGSIDTYRGHVPVRTEHGKLYGRGVTQAKGPLVAGISALHQLKKSEISDKTFVVAACTNTLNFGDNGSRFILDKFSPDIVINLEPTSWNATAHSYKGSYGFYYYHAQPNAHYTAIDQRTSSQVFNFVNSLTEYLQNLYPNRLSEDMKDRLTTPQVEIHYIESANDGLTDKTSMKLNTRYPVGFDLDSYRQIIEELKGDATIEEWGNIPAAHVDTNHELAQLFHATIKKHNGDAEARHMTTSSEFATYVNAWPETPILSYGPGDHTLDRTPDEHLNLDEFEKSIAVLADVLRSV